MVMFILGLLSGSLLTIGVMSCFFVAKQSDMQTKGCDISGR